ncbi:cation-binding protein [Francisella sp. SYW-9]|uniref:cation-binding protein n=1 Tax=Francisella sp. SYW-9 TaxID=2610888 RepID=UPI00123CF85D|nr:cation-binding protein [Francisella sp. SYW-9]
MNMYIVTTFILLLLLIFIIIISLLFNIKNCRRILSRFKIYRTNQLSKSLRHLLSKADNKTKKSFKTTANFFIHINTSKQRIVEQETNKTIGTELFKIEGHNYNQYLSNDSYVLELHKLHNNHTYKELGKFCNKVSAINGKIPSLVYSFEYKKLKDETFMQEEIKSIRSIIIQLIKIYKEVPNLILSISDIQQHPNYSDFIDCVKSHNIPLLSPRIDPNNIEVEINSHLETLNMLGNNILFNKHPQKFLNFTYFINDTYDNFKNLLKEQYYLDHSKHIKNILLYINNTRSDINQNLFQSPIKIHRYKIKTLKKSIWIGLGTALAFISIIFTVNIFTYKNILNEYKERLTTIPNKIEDLNKTICLSKNYTDNIGSKLFVSSLYPKKLFIHSINLNEVLKIQQQIASLLKDHNKIAPDDYITRTFIFLILIAPQNTNLKEMIKSNLQVWSLATNIPKKTINTYINGSVPDINPNISNINIRKLPDNNYFVKSSSYNLIKLYIAKNHNINLKTLNFFMDQISLPMAKQKIIKTFMKKVFPEVKDSLSNYNKTFLEELNIHINSSSNSQEDIQRIKKLIPTKKETEVYSLQSALDLLTNLDKKINKSLNSDSKLKTFWYQVVFQATYNDIMNNLALSKAKLVDDNTEKQTIINVGDNGGYNGNISIIYTKIGLNEVVLKQIASYKHILKLLTFHKIDTQHIENYYNTAIQSYIQDYKKAYIKLIASYKDSITPDDITSSLLLISSTNSQFNNMLKMLSDNTVFNKEILKEIPQLDLVSSYFYNVNKMITNPNDMDKYNQIIKDLANEINENGHEQASMNKITLNLFHKSKDSYFYKVNSLLKKNNISPNNSIIFTAPLQNIINFGKPYLIKSKYKQWNDNILPILNKYKKYYPFSKDSNKRISPDELNKVFGPKGNFWKLVNKDMYEIFEYKNGRWKSIAPNFFGENTNDMLMKLNNTQKLTNTLWDSSGKPKPINIKVKIMPSPNSLLTNNSFVKMTLLNIGDQKAVGISTQQKTINLKYYWFEKQPCSVGFIDSNDQINSIETRYNYWSFFYLLNQAKKKNDIYEWYQNGTVIKFKIDLDNIFTHFNN